MKRQSSVTTVKGSLRTVNARSVGVENLRFVPVPLTPVIDAEEIGVVTPYKAQLRAVRELLRSAGLKGVSVGSVEKFQGQVRAIA